MELYCTVKWQLPTVWTISSVIFAWTVVSSALPGVYRRISDECDWFGSGLEADVVGVRPVYLRCRGGKVQWEYPRGALRVVLRVGHMNRDFQVCLRVEPDSSGANMYLEGNRKLLLLHGRYDPDRRQRCFRSVGGQVAFFLEAQGHVDRLLRKEVFSFVYDLEPVQNNSFTECRPCTDKELIYAFCSSDFVVRGAMSSIYQNEAFQRTELTIKSRLILRDGEPNVFVRSLDANNRTVFTGTVYRPLHCGTKAGHGDFLFLGRWRLSEPVLRCAPRWTEWKKVRRKAAFSEHVDCILE